MALVLWGTTVRRACKTAAKAEHRIVVLGISAAIPSSQPVRPCQQLFCKPRMQAYNLTHAAKPAFLLHVGLLCEHRVTLQWG